MTKEWQKKIDKMPPKIREELLVIVKNIIVLHLSGYDIVAME